MKGSPGVKGGWNGGGKGGWDGGKGKWGPPAWGKDSWGKDSWGKGKGKKGSGLRSFPIEKRVWLGDIPETFNMKEHMQELLEHMKQAGNCKFVNVAKGQGGAAYETAEEATAAIAMLNGSTFQDAVIQVDVWTTKDA